MSARKVPAIAAVLVVGLTLVAVAWNAPTAVLAAICALLIPAAVTAG